MSNVNKMNGAIEYCIKTSMSFLCLCLEETESLYAHAAMAYNLWDSIMR